METNNAQRELICEACGASFGCYPAPEGGCWCAEVQVPDEARKDVRAKFGDCICPACLVKFAHKEASPKA